MHTARLWRSLGHHDVDGVFRIDGVTGPDEYSAVADNNTYTNLMARANLLAAAATGIDVDATGSAGLAGLLALRASGDVGEDERVALLFTGAARRPHERKERRDEELPRARHPVAEGLRAG